MIAFAEIGIVIVLDTSLFVAPCFTIPHCLYADGNPAESTERLVSAIGGYCEAVYRN